MTRRWGLTLLALIPAVIVVFSTWLVAVLAGRYELLGAAYGPVLNAGVLLRAFGMFASVVLVWGMLRSRAAGRVVLALAILSGPVAYGVVAAWRALDYFPPGQAAYYGVNPIFVAAIAGQCAAAGVAEMGWRWMSRRKGRTTPPALAWGPAAAIVLGLGVTYGTVLFQGGVPFFYIYQQGYLLLFT